MDFGLVLRRPIESTRVIGHVPSVAAYFPVTELVCPRESYGFHAWEEPRGFNQAESIDFGKTYNSSGPPGPTRNNAGKRLLPGVDLSAIPPVRN